MGVQVTNTNGGGMLVWFDFALLTQGLILFLGKSGSPLGGLCLMVEEFENGLGQISPPASERRQMEGRKGESHARVSSHIVERWDK